MGWLKGKQQANKARKQEKDARANTDTATDEKPVKQPARFSRWTKEQRDAMTARARAQRRYTMRWRIMSGGPDHDINLDNPQVRIEWELCDIENLRLVYKGRHRDEFLNKLPPECRAVYFEKDPDGKTYASEVESPAFFLGLLRGMGILIRGDKKSIEQLLKELDEQKTAENETTA